MTEGYNKKLRTPLTHAGMNREEEKIMAVRETPPTHAGTNPTWIVARGRPFFYSFPTLAFIGTQHKPL